MSIDPFRDRVAVITGGASGIGRAMASGFAARGAHLVLADIDEAALSLAEKELSEAGARVLAVPTDVARRESVAALADATFRHFGAAHIVCNNAGIAMLGSLAQADPGDWDTSMAINFWGVVHGVDAFAQRLIDQKQGGHILNTASMAGLVGMQYLGIYCASKFAVVGLSESLERELRPHDIGVSVLCPMIVATNIAQNSARRLGRESAPAGSGDANEAGSPPMRGSVIPVAAVVERVVRGIEQGDLYIFTHPEQREFLGRRVARMDAVFKRDF
jgi:NAD(P)-dependent dehydrogenase (short-subunit alcohol dehydrogenase family)